MDNERFSFLPLYPHGESALLIGSPSVELAKFLGERFDAVVIADWESDRLSEFKASLDDRRFKFINIMVGSNGLSNISVVESGFELVLLLWCRFYLGETEKWSEVLADVLIPRGRLIYIDEIDRPQEPAQQLTSDLLELQKQVTVLSGYEINPGCHSDELPKVLSAGSFRHVRKKVFTDSDLLTTSEEWKGQAQRVLHRAGKLIANHPGRFSSQIKKLHRKISKQLSNTTPLTPPFVMITGHKHLMSSVHKQQETIENYNSSTRTRDNRHYPEPPEQPKDPWRRILHEGPEKLQSQELLLLALSEGVKERLSSIDSMQLSERISNEYGTKAISEERNPAHLADMLSIPLMSACKIVAIFELGRRYFDEPLNSSILIRTPEDGYAYLKDMGRLKKEHLRGLYLNVQGRLIHDEVISIGTLVRSLVHPREVFSPALEHAANSVILAHNHPSGDLNPSENDITITKQLLQAGQILGIELLDHLIIGPSGFCSLKKKKII